MKNVFVYGPLTDKDVQVAVFGPSPGGAAPGRSELSGYRIGNLAGSPLPVLLPSGNSVTSGLLLRQVSDLSYDRLRFFAAVFDTELGEVTVSYDNSPVAADCIFPRQVGSLDGEPWLAKAWAADDKAVFLEICAEIMRCREERSAEDGASLLKGISGRVLARDAARRAQGQGVGLRSGLSRGDVRSVTVEKPYNSFFSVEEHRLSHRRFDGGWMPELLRTVFVSADASVVLPYDPKRDRVLLVEQFRPGPWARGDENPWCLEVVAGRQDQAENPEQTARREAVEEAGIDLGRMERIGSYYGSPGAMTEYLTGFIGEADLPGGGGLHGLATEHEDIRTIVLGRAEAMAAVASGEINNAHTLLPLFYLELHHSRLQAQWDAHAGDAAP